MKITFLGTGTSQGVPVITCSCEVCQSEDQRDKRLRCSLWVEVNDLNIVIDAGPDFRQQMLREKVPDIDAILITHEHKDHIAGLDDVRAYNFRHQKSINIHATPSVQEALKREYHYVFTPTGYPGLPKMKLIDLDGDFKVENQEVKVIDYLHYKLPVKGFRINDMAYLTDIKTITEKEKGKLAGCKVLIVSALRKTEHLSHLSLPEALELIEELKPEKAYLTHLSHLMGRHEDVSKELPANVEIAFDGLTLQL
ncbi:MAG: phosphoribosyl 1,2-cyclic phosphate phosphodiesterase [Patiriisocius sp.]|jgi:phosphoribosyl 1,2-cyclic phosphate phosphodiesterase